MSREAATSLKSLALQTERLPTGRRTLLRDLIVYTDGRDWLVPEGTETDYSSIPAIGRSLVRWSRVDIAGVVHDWLYLDGGQASRARADRIWRLVAQGGEHSANAFQAWVAWAALRGFGGLAWAQHRGTKAAWSAGITQAVLASVVILVALAAPPLLIAMLLR